ncbi:unnamed protein product [Rotaria socialis]|uniref:Tryptophan 2,3-dioxygenase n=3 Tax=Rotaria socialis TaxID=392032 RepID=A0A820XR47_9BILA|nr:unnamed protein product [Rotaria socialis]CAF4536892.1 unnamed protein product [Rotaria socialis]
MCDFDPTRNKTATTMSCPFMQPTFDNIPNDSSDNDLTGESPIHTTTQNGNGSHDEIVQQPLNYSTYLRTNILLSALKCLSHTNRSDNSTPPVHDEHFFILIHQVFELWFKQILFEIDSVRHIFDQNDDVIPFLFNINLRLKRTATIWNMLIDQLQLLESMTPMEFLEFREFITPASGFQSLQFRIIEMKLGLTDAFRSSYKTNYFIRTMFKGEQANELESAVRELPLLRHVERWLEKIYDNTSFDFNDVFKLAIQNMIEHEKEEKIRNGTDAEAAEGNANTTNEQFKKMADPNEYRKLLDNNERRISQKAMLSALMISHYHQEPCFQQAYEMLSLLMDIDGLMASWRYKHVVLVQRQIGRKPGTGGTGGFSYLKETISDKYQVFADLFNVSSYLIPQRFLPKFVNNAQTSTTTASSLELQPYSQPPIICKKQSRMPKYQSSSNLNQYYQIGFFFLLFVTGCLFGILFSRFAR